MTLVERLKKREGIVDVVLDTDTYNEIDDQFALSYLLLSKEAVNVKAFYAAPFFNERSEGPENGMERSYDEILHLLDLMDREDMKDKVFKGSRGYLVDEKTPQESDAAKDLVERSKAYTEENPLYVVAIGAITNIASAIIMDPSIINRIVVVWLGGHGLHFHDTREFNMFQDVAAARIIFGSKVPFVQLPCNGVVSEFRISGPELEAFLVGKNKLSDYLSTHTVEAVREYTDNPVWTRVIWDVTAVGWLILPEAFSDRIIKSPIPEYDNTYSYNENRHEMCYVYYIDRDKLMIDLVKKLTSI